MLDDVFSNIQIKYKEADIRFLRAENSKLTDSLNSTMEENKQLKKQIEELQQANKIKHLDF